MCSNRKIKKLYQVSLMALAIGLGSVVFSSAQALLPPGSAAPATDGKPAGLPVFKDGVLVSPADTGMITPANNAEVPSEVPQPKMPAGPKIPTLEQTQADEVPALAAAPTAPVEAASAGLPTINQDNPLFVQPQVKAPLPSAPQTEEDILSAIDNELFNQMSDIEKQTALLTLELRREKIRSEIDAMKAQRKKAQEEEKDLDAERENKRLAMEKELEQKIIKEQIQLRKVELAFEKLRQERLLNSYKEHMLQENQKWIESNQKIYNEIQEQKKEQENWTKKYKEKLQNVSQQSANLLRDAQNKMNGYKKEVSDLQAQISILKARLEAQQRPNPFATAAGDGTGGADDDNNSNSSINLGDLYVIMEITGQGDNINAKLLNRDGQTFMVKKGTKLKSGDVVEEIAPTYIKADRLGEKSYLYFAAGGILDSEPEFGGAEQLMREEAQKGKEKKPTVTPRGLVSSKGVPGITRDMMLR